MKILIVDDDRGTLNALKAGLTSFDYEVVEAEDGQEALKIIEFSTKIGEPVEFLVTDLKMPGMNGLELVRLAKKITPGLLTVLMTAYGDNDIRNEVMVSGLSGQIDKPFTPEAFLKTIRMVRMALERSKLRARQNITSQTSRFPGGLKA